MFPPVLGPGQRGQEAEAAQGQGVCSSARELPEAGEARGGGASQGGQVGVARLQMRELPPPEMFTRVTSQKARKVHVLFLTEMNFSVKFSSTHIQF